MPFQDDETRRLEKRIWTIQKDIEAIDNPSQTATKKKELEGIKLELAHYRPQAEAFAERDKILAKIKTQGRNKDLESQLQKNTEKLRKMNVRDANMKQP